MLIYSSALTSLSWQGCYTWPISGLNSAAAQWLINLVYFVVLKTYIQQLSPRRLNKFISSARLFVTSMADIEAVGSISCGGNACIKETRSVGHSPGTYSRLAAFQLLLWRLTWFSSLGTKVVIQCLSHLRFWSYIKALLGRLVAQRFLQERRFGSSSIFIPNHIEL